MPTIKLRVDSIFEGDAPSQYFAQQGQFLSSIGIDPDYPIDSSGIKPSGFIIPIGYSKFSSTGIDATVVAIINTPKNTLTYVVTSNGKLTSYNSSLASETSIGTVAGSTASGACYYNNYIYIFGTGASHDDVSRYGPLDNSPSLVDNVWKGATLGSLAALSNTTYPTLRSASLPNHFAFVHGDNSLYFLDFESKSGGSYPGQGLVHRIHTKKTTNEGDTNDTTVPSAYNVLDLPIGFYPTSACSVSTNIMIMGIYATDTTIEQGKAAFILWDPTDTTSFFLGPIFLEDTLGTALLNKGGNVFMWTGNAQGGCRLIQYLGGQSTKDIVTMGDSLPPLAYAVESMGNRIAWGGFTTNPNDRACVWAYGSKDPRLPAGVHNIAKASNAGTTPIVTAIKKVQQANFKQQKLVVAWRDSTGTPTYGIDSYSASATLGSNIRFMFNIGQAFDIQKIRIPFAGAMAANTTITPLIYLDDLSSNPSTALNVINNSNYAGKRKAIYQGPQLKGYAGNNNFVLELAFSGTNPLGIALPILIDVDVHDSEPA